MTTNDPYAAPPPGAYPGGAYPQGSPQAGYPQGGYGPGGPGGPGYGMPVIRRNGLGTAALVLGIVALLFCWTVVAGIVGGILAVVFGVIGRSRYRRGEATNGGMALAGLIVGAVGLLLSIALIIAGVSILNSKAGRTYQACLRNANGNQAKITACNHQFAKNL